jgi:hypothetical protein
MEPRGRSKTTAALVLASSIFVAASAGAAPIVLSGDLDDAGNTALVWSDLGAALFDNDNNIANNVAIYAFSVAAASTVSFESVGYAAFGIEPYFSIFSGDGAGATFLDSNGLSDPFNIDFSFSKALAAGDYMLAIGSWVNMSFAENNPDADPTLGDGFTGLGVPSSGTYYYEVHVTCEPESAPAADVCTAEPGGVTTGTTGTVPEPASFLLSALGLGAAVRMFRER